MNSMHYYKITALDTRISNPDQRLTTDIEKWSSALSTFYSNFTKPILDMVLFSKKLAVLIGWEGPTLTILYYLTAGTLIKFISPAFSKMYAQEMRLEGQYRQCHSDILAHSEEIAFYNGHEWERNKMNSRFSTLLKHNRLILYKRMLMGIFDSMLVKYGATMSGYTIVALPVFGPNSAKYLKEVGTDSSKITKDYIRNTSLLINLAKAIGRFITSYKEIQQLAGYTQRIDEMEIVLSDLDKDVYERSIVVNSYKQMQDSRKSTRGDFKSSPNEIKFEDVPIVAPNGDLLFPALNFTIPKGKHVMVKGSNGVGKSSLFKLIANLWPHFDGSITAPHFGDIMYIPQRAYCPPGTLRDQVIYPDTVA